MSVRALPDIKLMVRGEVRIPRRDLLGPIVLALCAAALWAASLTDIEIRRMTDVGLISVLPAHFFLALMVLTVSFCLTLRQQQLPVPLLFLLIVVLIFMLYGVTSIIEEMPRFHSVWKHLGVTDYIIRKGQVDPGIDAYFNWPGFFILFAFVSEVGALENWPALVAWVPVFLNLIYLGPLLMIFSSATKDKRLVWLGVWIFYLANWVGQDYFSPQGFNYFFYLAILGILLKWFKVPVGGPHPLLERLGIAGRYARLPESVRGWLSPTDKPSSPSRREQRAALLGIVLALFAVVVASHQLTPFAILAGVAALVAFNRCTARGLPVVMAILIVLWLRFMAEGYMSGHGEEMASRVGDVSSAVDQNASSRLGGSPGHTVVVYARTGMTLVLWGLALLGGLRRIRHGHRDLTYALMAATPFPLVVLQPYGGEMILRVYLLTLPFMVFFAAALFFTTPTVGRSWRTTAALGLLSVALLGAFFVTRYGNEKMDYATREELAAAEYLYSVAPPGSLLLVGTTNTALKFQDYEKYRYWSLTNRLEWRNGPIERNVEAVARLMDNRRFPTSYLLITRSQIANDELFWLFPTPLEDLEQALAESDQFTVIYADEAAKIFTLARAPGGSGQ